MLTATHPAVAFSTVLTQLLRTLSERDGQPSWSRTNDADVVCR